MLSDGRVLKSPVVIPAAIWEVPTAVEPWGEALGLCSKSRASMPEMRLSECFAEEAVLGLALAQAHPFQNMSVWQMTLARFTPTAATTDTAL